MHFLKSLVLIAGAMLVGVAAPARIQLTDITHA